MDTNKSINKGLFYLIENKMKLYPYAKAQVNQDMKRNIWVVSNKRAPNSLSNKEWKEIGQRIEKINKIYYIFEIL